MEWTGIVTNTLLSSGIEVPLVINGLESMWFEVVMSCLKFCGAVCLKGLKQSRKEYQSG